MAILNLGHFSACRIIKYPFSGENHYIMRLLSMRCPPNIIEEGTMIFKGENRPFRFFSILPLYLTWNSSQNRKWSAAMRQCGKNPEKWSAYFLHGWDMVRTFPSKSDEKVTFWITLDSLSPYLADIRLSRRMQSTDHSKMTAKIALFAVRTLEGSIFSSFFFLFSTKF